jgi:adenine deaminase
LPKDEGETSGETYPVIEIVPGQIVTRKAIEKMKVVEGAVMPDLERDILKLVVVEHHKASSNRGLGKLPPAPFALLYFLALPVIPKLRLTDSGLVDVNEFKLIK